jgi:AraC-like DNA-binding protein
MDAIAARRKRRARAPAREREEPRPDEPLAIDDRSGPMGIQLVSLRQRDRERLDGAGPVLVVPIRTGTVGATIGAAHHAVDRTGWLLVPPGARATLTAESPIAHALVLFIGRELVARLAGTYPADIDQARFAEQVRAPQLLPRTTWVGEVFHRYLFERAVCRHTDNDATRFLETEIAKELFFACRDRNRQLCHTAPAEGRSATVQRALRHLEDHLFEPDVMRDLAKACATSASTLLRSFKREVGEGPLAYLRTRRLDEARLLLQSGRLTVSEVSMAVGYRNFAAFSHAFRARFGVRPSDVVAGAR